MPYQFVQRAVDPDMPQMVGLGGLEPPTLPLSGVRSNHLSYRPIPMGAARTGGASRDRTDDPLLAKQVLSQLSYGPVVDGGREGRAIAQGAARIIPSCFWIAGVLCGRRIGLEPSGFLERR